MSASVEALILAAVQLVWPLLVDRVPVLASLPKKAIPILNFALALVVKLASPADANAGLFGLSGKALLDIVAEAVLQTLLVTGAHSGSKNVWQLIAGAAVSRRR